MHSSWRDCKAWEDEGLRMSTTSNEACKWFDASMSQYVGWYNDVTLNGLDGTLANLHKADPNFVMGRVLSNGLQLIGTAKTTRLDPTLKQAVDDMMSLAEGKHVTARERSHAEAIKLFADGYLEKAADVWESILAKHPTDMMAIKCVHDVYFYLGRQKPMRDSLLRVVPHWKPSIPLYSYLHGMQAFGYVENGQYSEAEASAFKGLEANDKDAWSTHSLAHVYDVLGHHDKGIKQLTDTVDKWTVCDMLACHNFWHLGLYYVERGDHEAALSLYDQQIGSRVQPDCMLDLVDAASLLWRFEMEGVPVGNRWRELLRLVENHLDDHVLSFNDAHISMVLLGSKESQLLDKFHSSYQDFLKSVDQNTNGARTGGSVGLPLCLALDHYAQGRYDEAANILAPLKTKLIDLGGSDPQRDVFNQVTIHSCMRAKSDQLQNLGREMIYSRKAEKDSPLADRLIARYLGSHHS